MSDSVTKAELIDSLIESYGTHVSKKDMKRFLDTFAEVVKKYASQGKKINIAPLGTFRIKELAEREGRNPRTGERITIPAKRNLVFTQSAKMKRFLND